MTKKRTNPTILCKFDEYYTFQGYYRIRPSDTSHDQNYVFNRCIRYIIKWLNKRIGPRSEVDLEEISFLDQYTDTDDFDVFNPNEMIIGSSKVQFDIKVLGIKDFGEWTLRITEPNNKLENIYKDRIFTTDIAVKKSTDNDDVFLAVRTKCKASHSRDKTKSGAFRPSFVPWISDDKALFVTEGNIESTKYAINLNKTDFIMNKSLKNAEIELINNIINNHDRQMPVILCPANKSTTDLISRFSYLMSGEAYVITDEQNNKYHYLIEKMQDKGILPKPDKKGKNNREEELKIEDNLLCIFPQQDGKFPIDWIDANEMKQIAKKNKKNKDDDAIWEIRKRIGLSCMSMRDASNQGEINFGGVLFYSDLWNAYFEKTDKEAFVALQCKVDELMANKLKTEQKHAAELSEAKNEYNKKVKEKEKENQKLKNRGEDIENKQKEAEANAKKANDDASKRVSEIEKEYKEKCASLNDVITLAEKLWVDKFVSIPYERKALLTWVSNNMSDKLEFWTQAKDSYNELSLRFDETDEDRLRNAFIFLYALILHKSKEIPDAVWNAICEDNRFSIFVDKKDDENRAYRAGDDSNNCDRDYGHPATYHINYSSNYCNHMFRIYFDHSKKTGKYLIVAVTDHV